MQTAKRDEEKGGYKILRPGFFMGNHGRIFGAITVSVLKAGLPEDATIQLVCVADIGHAAAGVFRASCQDPALYTFQILLIVGEVSTIFEQDDFSGAELVVMFPQSKPLVADIKRVHRARITSECLDEDGQMVATRQAYQDMTPPFAKWAELRSMPSLDRSQGRNRVTIRKILSGRQQ
ncbi:hypothetical protein F5146DRAFT_996609 [Armillaria mellea]|nr:hypothetical protein F5146DRAFT_996609 [Armillaria mellea]